MPCWPLVYWARLQGVSGALDGIEASYNAMRPVLHRSTTVPGSSGIKGDISYRDNFSRRVARTF